MVEEDRSKLMRSDPSVLNVLFATGHSQLNLTGQSQEKVDVFNIAT